MAGDERLREQVYSAFKHRAMIYYHIFDELRGELGEARAIAIMKRAIERRGREIGLQFAGYGPSDLAGLRTAFLAGVPDEGRMFAPEVVRADTEALDIKFHRCPLKEAWQEAGLPSPTSPPSVTSRVASTTPPSRPPASGSTPTPGRRDARAAVTSTSARERSSPWGPVDIAVGPALLTRGGTAAHPSPRPGPPCAFAALRRRARARVRSGAVGPATGARPSRARVA